MALSELDAVNYCLICAGESPVNSLSGSDQAVDTSTANFLLDQVVAEAQERGIDENVYTSFYTPDAVTGQVSLPTNIIDVYLKDTLLNLDSKVGGYVDAQVRGTLLWNQTNQTDNWLSPYDYSASVGTDGFELTVKVLLDWDDLNVNTRRAVMTEAARRYQLVTQNDPAVNNALEVESNMSRAKSRSNDINNKNRGLFTHGDWSRVQAGNRHLSFLSDPYYTRTRRGI